MGHICYQGEGQSPVSNPLKARNEKMATTYQQDHRNRNSIHTVYSSTLTGNRSNVKKVLFCEYFSLKHQFQRLSIQVKQKSFKSFTQFLRKPVKTKCNGDKNPSLVFFSALVCKMPPPSSLCWSHIIGFSGNK